MTTRVSTTQNHPEAHGSQLWDWLWSLPLPWWGFPLWLAEPCACQLTCYTVSHASAHLAGGWLWLVVHLAKAADGAVPGLPPKNPKWFIKAQHETTSRSPSKEGCRWGLVKEFTIPLWEDLPPLGQNVGWCSLGNPPHLAQGLTHSRGPIHICQRWTLSENWKGSMMHSVSSCVRVNCVRNKKTRALPARFVTAQHPHNFAKTLDIFASISQLCVWKNLSPLKLSSVSFQQYSRAPAHLSSQSTRPYEKDAWSCFLFHSHLMPSVCTRGLSRLW